MQYACKFQSCELVLIAMLWRTVTLKVPNKERKKRNRKNWGRLNPEEMRQSLQDAWRNLQSYSIVKRLRRFPQVSWRCCCSASGFSLPPFLHVITDRLDGGEIRSPCGSYRLLSDSLCIQKSHWIITRINGKMNVWKCILIFHTNTQNIQITGLKPFFGVKILMCKTFAQYKKYNF